MVFGRNIGCCHRFRVITRRFLNLPHNMKQKIDRKLFEATHENLQECFDEIEAAGGVEEYLFHASQHEKSLVKRVFELCEDIVREFGPLSD